LVIERCGGKRGIAEWEMNDKDRNKPEYRAPFIESLGER